MWTQEKTLKLIDLWQKTPILWDTKNKDYRNRDLRKSALEALAVEFEMTSLDIEKKMTGLKNQFRREHNKIRTSGSSSFSVEWFGYRPLLFLQEALVTRELLDHFVRNEFNIKKSELCIENDVFGHNDTVSYMDLKEERQDDTPEPEEDKVDDDIVIFYPATSPPPPKRRKSQTHTVSHPHLLNIYSKPTPEVLIHHSEKPLEPTTNFYEGSLLEDIKPTKSALRDEFSVYADYVANCLRKFRDQHSVLVAQNKINNILFDGAIGRLAFYGTQERDIPQTNFYHRSNLSSECSSTRKDSECNNCFI